MRSVVRWAVMGTISAGLIGCGPSIPSSTLAAVSAGPTAGLASPNPAASTTASPSAVAGRPSIPVGTACGSSVPLGPMATTPAPAGPVSQPAWSKAGVGGPVSKVAWSPDGTLLASTPGDLRGTNDTASLWTAAGLLVAKLSGHAGVVHCAAWSSDSQFLATAGADGSVRLWDRTGRFVRSLPGTEPVFSLAWSPDGSSLAAGAISLTGQLAGVIRLWHRDGTLVKTLGTSFTGGKFLNLAWSPDGRLLAAGASDYIDWQADGSQVAILRPDGTPAWAMAWSADGTGLALGDENGSLAIVDTQGSSLVAAQFQAGVNALSYAPDGSGLIVGLNGQIQFVHPLNLQYPAHAIWSADTANDGHVAWSPDGHRLAIAVTDGLAILAADGSAVASLTGCPGDPVAFAWAGTKLAAATSDGRLCAWLAP